jgi:hypothetical protein
MPFKKGDVPWNVGLKLPDNYRKKISLAHIGLKQTLETLEKRRSSMLGKNKGERNGMWKDHNIKYRALHFRIRNILPKPDFCELCHINEPKQISNISGEYLHDLSDWQWACVSCHRKYDLGRRKSNIIN